MKLEKIQIFFGLLVFSFFLEKVAFSRMPDSFLLEEKKINHYSDPKKIRQAARNLVVLPSKIKIINASSNDDLKVLIDPALDQLPSVSLNRLSQKVYFHFPSHVKEPTLFVRNPDLLSWDQSDHTFQAEQFGQTEIFFSFGQNLIILPITIGDDSQNGRTENLSARQSQNLKNIPKNTVDVISEKIPEKTRSRQPFPSVEELIAKISEDLDPESVTELWDDIENPGENAESLVSSLEEHLEKSEVEEEVEANVPLSEPGDLLQKQESMSSPNHRSVIFQVVEERSTADKIYPIPHITISVPGLDRSLTTDGAGRTRSLLLPKGSRFILRLDDPDGFYRPGAAQVQVSLDGSKDLPQVIKVKLIKQHVYESYALLPSLDINSEQIELEDRQGTGSVCYQIQNSQGLPQKGVSIQADSHDQPLFFNRFRLPDESISETDENGRFCFLEIAESGPISFRLFQAEDQKELGTAVSPVLLGRHLEQVIQIQEDRYEFHTDLVASGTGFEHVKYDDTSKLYRSVDYTDLSLLGGDSGSFYPVGQGKSGTQEVVSFVDGQSFYLSLAPEFEQTLYSFKNKDFAQSVTTLIPRGFVETVAIESGIYDYNDPANGTVMVDGAQEVRLVDENGRDVAESIKAGGKNLFFSVPPGFYTAIFMSQSGDILDSDTVLVYSDTLSFVPMSQGPNKFLVASSNF
jgi:hypothetical protein